MRIVRSRFTNFRNLRGTVELCPGINVLFGANGQGKTNILEAIHVASQGRSFRAGQLEDLVAFGKEYARIELEVDADGVTIPMAVHIRNGQKRHLVGGTNNCSVEEAGEALRIVFFGPEDLNLVKGGPSARRELVDKGILVYYPTYGRLLRSYQKVLRERNVLLRDLARGYPPVPELVDAYEMELAYYGAQILSYRLKYLKEFVPVAARLMEFHTRSQLHLEIKYLASTSEEVTAESDISELQAQILARLKRDRAGDAAAGRTRVGPHADDLELLINGRAARFFCSQGEQRTLAVSLKTAQLVLWKERFNVVPVLLLDDVLSQLDRERRMDLLSHVVEWGVQTVLTTTESSDVIIKKDVCLLEVRAGEVTRVR